MLRLSHHVRRTAEREQTGMLDINAGKAGLRLHVPSMALACRAPLIAASPAQMDTLNGATKAALLAGEAAHSLPSQ